LVTKKKAVADPIETPREYLGWLLHKWAVDGDSLASTCGEMRATLGGSASDEKRFEEVVSELGHTLSKDEVVEQLLQLVWSSSSGKALKKSSCRF
jgi:hypothetical protein